MNTIDRASAEGFDLTEFHGYAVVTDLWAEGASSRVYQAIEVSLDRPVALKLLKPSPDHPAEARARFILEGRIGALLDHRHIVPTFHLSEGGQEPFLAMGWCGGGTLAERLNGKPWEPTESVELLLKLADALAHAHERGVIHRDIKPGNILFDDEDEPMLADFGLARLNDGSPVLTGTCDIRGTPAYIAPEVALKGSRSATEKADLYSLGAVLFELLAGRAPHVGQSTSEILATLRTGSNTSIRKIHKDVPKDLAVICDRCLEQDPDLRPSNARKLEEELGRFLQGRPVTLKPVSPLEHFTSWAKRRPGLTLGLLGVSAILAVSTGIAVWQWQRSTTLASDLQTTVADLSALNRRLEVEVVRGELEEAFKLLENSSAPKGLARLAKILRQMPEHPEAARRTRWLLHDRGWVQPGGTALPHDQEPIWAGFRLGTDEVLTADQAGTIRGWSVALSAQWPTNMAPKWQLSLGSSIREVHLSAEGGTVLGWHEDGSVQIRSLDSSREPVRVATNATALAVTLEKNAWAVVEQSGLLRWGAFNLSDQIHSVDLAIIAPRAYPVGAVAFDRTTGLIGLANKTNGSVFVFDTKSKSVRPLPATEKPAEHLAFSPNGQFLLHIDPRSLLVWDMASQQAIEPPIRHDADMRHVIFTPAGDQLMAATEGGKVLLWDVATGRLNWEFQQPSGLNHVAFAPDRRTFFTSSDDGSIRAFDLPQKRLLTMANGHDLFTWNTAVSPDGLWLVSASADHTVRLWKSVPQKTEHLLEAHGRTLAADWLPETKTLALVSGDGHLHLWNPVEPAKSEQIRFGSNVTALLGWNNGSALLVGRSDGDVSVQPLGRGTPRQLTSLDAPVTGLIADPARNRVVATTSKGWQLIDLSTGLPHFPKPILCGGVRDGAISPDGTRVVLAGDEWGARMFDADTGASVKHLEHLGPVRQIRFSADGKRVLTAGLDFMAKVWDGSTGDLLLSPVRHPEWVTCVMFSHDGAKMLTGGPKAAFLWDAATGRELVRYEHAPSDVVRELDHWAEQGLVLTATTGGRISLWDEKTGMLLSEENLPGPSPEQPSRPKVRFVKEPAGYVAWSERGTALWKFFPPETAPADLADLFELVSGHIVRDDGSVERIDPVEMEKRAVRLGRSSRPPEKF
jgi:eukaryotic-like serine/threonine-protein kinase